MLFNFLLRPVETIVPWGDETPTLSWFGLSYGWYWLELGGQEVFRARTVTPGKPPYADYQVARLWEDLLELFSYELVRGGPPRRFISGHFVAAPEVEFLWDADSIHLRWESNPAGVELWEPVEGSATIPAVEFIEQVRAFERAFIAAMEVRVIGLVGQGGLPGVDIDLHWLEHEQKDRATWLESRLARCAPR